MDTEIGINDAENFCLKPWTVFGKEDITTSQTVTAGKVATFLISTERFENLENFVSSIPDYVLEVFLQNEQFRRALIDLRFHQGRFEDVCGMIKSGNFHDGSDLLETWDLAHYVMWEREFQKPLSALTRFRIRKRNPPPTSICKGGRKTRTFDDKSKTVLKSWFNDHPNFPYPLLSEREEMAQRTGLTHTQIRTWFANARRRQVSKQQKKQGRKAGAISSPSKMRKGQKQKFGSVGKSPVTSGSPADTHTDLQAGLHAQGDVLNVSNSAYLQPSSQGLQTSDSRPLQGLLNMCNSRTSSGSSMMNSSQPLNHAVCRLYPSTVYAKYPSLYTECYPTHSVSFARPPQIERHSEYQTQIHCSVPHREHQITSQILPPDAQTDPTQFCKKAWPEQITTGPYLVERKPGTAYPMQAPFSGRVSVITPHEGVISQTTGAKSFVVASAANTVCEEQSAINVRMGSMPQVEILGHDTTCIPNWDLAAGDMSPCPLRSQVSELHMTESVQESILGQQNQVEDLPFMFTTHKFLYGEFGIPSFLVPQPRASFNCQRFSVDQKTTNAVPTNIPSQMNLPDQNMILQPPQQLDSGSPPDVDQVAHILIGMATKTTGHN